MTTYKAVKLLSSMKQVLKEYYDIYHEMLKHETNSDPCYLISYRPLEGKHSFVAIHNTMWVGNDNKKEIRRADLVNPIVVKSHYGLLEFPLITIENCSELTTFLRVGGHALVKEGIIKRNWKISYCYWQS